MRATDKKIPSRWQWQNIQHPPKLLAWAMAKAGVVVKPEDQDVQSLAKGLTQSDPLADSFVEWTKTQPPGVGRRLLEQALEHGIEQVKEAPEELVKLMTQVETLPEWVDYDTLVHGQETMLRLGRVATSALKNISLMGGYYNSAVSKPLAMTGQLSKRAYGRTAETSHYAFNIMNSKGLKVGSEGFKDTLRVRVMHTMIRQKLLADPKWKTEEWGIPINQSDMAGTGLQFSITLIISVMLFGFRLDKYERESVIHLWRYASFLMGVEDEYNPKNFKEALRSIYIQLLSSPEADADSRALAQALYNTPLEHAHTPWQKFKGRVLQQFNLAVITAVMQKHVTRSIGLPNTYLHWLIYLAAPFVFMLESIRMVIPGLTGLAIKVGRIGIRSYVKSMTKGKQPHFDASKQPNVSNKQTAKAA